jgi:diguanylate cyclase (GGDEF)-like protein/PAS domain S-box-containing protein
VKHDNIIQLLIINNSDNDAVETSNQLRNDGLTLRPKIISNAELFEKELCNKKCDIILYSANMEGLAVGTVLKKLKELNGDAAVIVIGDKTADEVLNLMKQGVSAVVPEEPEELLTLTVKKEFAALKGLRSESALTQQLVDSESRCQQLIDSSRDAIAYVHEGMHILTNDPYYKMFGYESRDDIEAMPLMDLVASENASQLKEYLRRFSQYDAIKQDSKGDNVLKVNGVKEDESEFQMKMEFQPATMDGEDCIQIIIRNENVSQKVQEKLQEKLAALSDRCQETQLYNRRFFLESLEKAANDAIENDNTSYLLFMSLDKFLEIRETLGVINSDQIIVDVAEQINKLVDEKTVLARFESYRFAAIVKTDDEKYALGLADKIRETIEQHIAQGNDKSVTATCSIGVVTIDSTCNGAQNSLSQAQNACKIAAEKGGNQVHQYVPDASELNDKQLMKFWANEIENAIKQQRLFMVYQPFVHLMGDGSENYELFIRMRNDKGDIIFPEEFLPPSEAAGHSIHIDRWVIADAMRALSERYKEGHENCRFIIKLTSASLTDEKFLAWVTHNLERFEIKPESLIFQVRAQQAAEHLRGSQTIVKKLHELGCAMSLEQFGLEENAFTLLKHIKADYIKLHADMVKNISTNAEKLEQLNSVCSQANELGVKTIVAYVEEASALSIIWQSGAQFIQGTFIHEASESLEFDFTSFA